MRTHSDEGMKSSMEEERESLQDPENWDFERAERRGGVKGARAIVSVAFGRDDFESVAACAERNGKRTSEFIREAALEKASSRGSFVSFSGTRGSVLFSDTSVHSTRLSRMRLSGPIFQLEETSVAAAAA